MQVKIDIVASFLEGESLNLSPVRRRGFAVGKKEEESFSS